MYDHAYPEYVSANNYQSYDCVALANEYTRVNQYIDANANQRTGLQASGIGIGVSGNRHGIYPTVSVGLGLNQWRQTVIIFIDCYGTT